MLTRLLTAATLIFAVTVLPTVDNASAQEAGCERSSKIFGTCIISVPGSDGTPGAQPVSNPGRDAEVPTCTVLGQPTPCSDPVLGAWSNDLQCYLKRSSPQPDSSSPLWGANYPEGAVYDCLDPTSGAYSNGARLWLPGPPEQGLTPQHAAEAVVRRMDLRAADIGIVPEDEPGSIGAVGAPVYMWTTRGPATFGPQVLTGSAGGVTITATAKVDRIVWAMGDGTSVTCRTPGTVYEDRYGFNMSPDCGHRYSRTSAGRPGNAYPITATSYWLVDWTGPAGSAGQIPLMLSSDTSIQVGELQALVTQ